MSTNNAVEVVSRLVTMGITYQDAVNLRKIAMVLHRWHEQECGMSNETCSYVLVRDEAEDGYGTPYMEYHPHRGKSYRVPIPDSEQNAIKRLKKIIANYPDLSYYIQGDPRGAPLYIVPGKDIPEGESIESYYNRGVAVYK